jgi:transposase
MELEVLELRQENARLAAENAALRQRLEQQDVIIAALRAEIAAMKVKLGENSQNSHKPPSTDAPSARALRRRKAKSERKRGGQAGHRGWRRELVPIEQVDGVEVYLPQQCGHCGEALSAADRVGEPVRFQVTELPEPKPQVTEHQAYACRCSHCRHVTQATLPASVVRSNFGPRLLATMALFTGGLHLSREKAVVALRWLCRVVVSVGALSESEARVSLALAAPVAQAEAAVQTAPVKHCDATSWWLGTTSRALWTVATTLVTVFKITTDGTREHLKALLGQLSGILVSDRAKVFLFWQMDERQICWAHLIRKWVAFTDLGGDAKRVGDALLEQTSLVFAFWHRVRDGTLSRRDFQELIAPSQFRIIALLTQGTRVPGIAGASADILAHKDALFTFVEHEGVEPTNNHAERELRALVLWRRTSFGSKSERGLRFTERIMTVVQTLKKQHRDLLDYLTETMQNAAAGQPAPSLLPKPQAANGLSASGAY